MHKRKENSTHVAVRSSKKPKTIYVLGKRIISGNRSLQCLDNQKKLTITVLRSGTDVIYHERQTLRQKNV